MSHNQHPAPEGKDPALWEIAQKRASFKRHLLAYIIVNAFLWAMWLIKGNNFHSGAWNDYQYPWPIWTTLGWGIGIAFHFTGAYIFPQTNSVEREYQKLKIKN